MVFLVSPCHWIHSTWTGNYPVNTVYLARKPGAVSAHQGVHVQKKPGICLLKCCGSYKLRFNLCDYVLSQPVLQYIRGFDPQEAGFILVTQPVVQAIFSSYAGSLSDKIEPAKISSLGMGIIAAGLVS